MHIDVSVVVPVYNSEQTIALLVDGVHRVLAAAGKSFEMILVDDCSNDASWRAIQQLAATHADVRGMHLRRNYGQHNALLAGIRAARGDVIVTMDDDLQHPPEEIPNLLAQIEAGSDVVYGFPRKLPHSATRNVFSWFTKVALQKAMGEETARHASAFRAFRTSLREAFRDYSSAYVAIDVLLTWGTRGFDWIYVEHRPRQFGTSNYTVKTLATHALTMITGFSTLPLRIASVAGLFFTLFGGVLLLYVVGRYLVAGTTLPGFPFLASAISIFAGAQLCALGIMGEYLARMHVRTLGRPPYLVGGTTAPNADERP